MPPRRLGANPESLIFTGRTRGRLLVEKGKAYIDVGLCEKGSENPQSSIVYYLFAVNSEKAHRNDVSPHLLTSDLISNLSYTG